MFTFVSGQPRPMLGYLTAYLDDPHWCHAADVVPMVAMSPDRGWPLWTPTQLGRPEVLDHLCDALGHWRAFRTSRPGSRARTDLRLRLGEFIGRVQGIPEARLHLSEVSEDDIGPFAADLTDQLRRFALAVKGTDSCVLPSKTAHFLLLGLVPAFDRQVIRDRVLWRLAPRAGDMEGYVLLSWWVLRRLVEEGALLAARRRVAAHMLSRVLPWTGSLPRPRLDNWLLQTMDSVVAEYTLIGMARTVESRYLLRWTAGRPAPRVRVGLTAY